MDSLQNVERYIFSFFPHEPTSGQREACLQLCRFLFDANPHSAFLLRGYAGTGKTSLVSALIQAAPAMQIETLLLAPTGRAAKVLSGYSHRPAFTIHKKIYVTVTDPVGSIRTMRVRNKYSYTLFIVDEASMISTGVEGDFGSRHSLLEDLIGFVQEGDHCRLLLIGDTAQLPPVGMSESRALNAGYLTLLADMQLFQSEMTEVVRQEHESGILHNATFIRQQIAQMDDNDAVQLPLFSIEGRSDVVRVADGELEDILNKEYSNGSQEDVVFVTRSNKRANLFNQEIRNRVLYHEEMLNVGDYLMVVKNNYYWLDSDSDISFIANGDMVEVLSARNQQDLYGFHYIDATLRFVDYPDMDAVDCKLLLDTLFSESPSLTANESKRLFDAVSENYDNIPNRAARLRAVKNDPYYNALQVKFAYALTCHKTQGGQWPVVFLDQGYVTDDMMTKDYLRWLYTAFTRATQKVYLLGFDDKFFA